MNKNDIKKNDRHRFNIIDILIIVAVIAVITFAANILMNDLLSGDIENIEYVIKLSEVRYENTDSIAIGDKVSSRITNAPIGTVSNVESVNAASYTFNYETDRFIKVEHSDKYDVYITVEAVCSKKNNMYLVNDNVISANSKLDIVVPFNYSSAEIVKVSLDEKSDGEVFNSEK